MKESIKRKRTGENQELTPKRNKIRVKILKGEGLFYYIRNKFKSYINLNFRILFWYVIGQEIFTCQESYK